MAKTEKKDFKKLFNDLKKKVDASPVLSKNPMLYQQLKDFERMAEMNDKLWEELQSQGYTYINEKTMVPCVNPTIAAFNKNASQCLKTAQWLEEKTKGIAIDDDSKSW